VRLAAGTLAFAGILAAITRTIVFFKKRRTNNSQKMWLNIIFF
jgi:hypothetical protein